MGKFDSTDIRSSELAIDINYNDSDYHQDKSSY